MLFLNTNLLQGEKKLDKPPYMKGVKSVSIPENTAAEKKICATRCEKGVGWEQENNYLAVVIA